MAGQPNIPNSWVFDVTAEAVESGGINPSVVINKGANNLQFRTTIYNGDGTTQDAGVSAGINGTQGHINYYATKLNAPAPYTLILPGTVFTMAAPHPQHVMSPTFNTNGGAGNLDPGTWLVSVLVDFQGTPHQSVAAGFTQILLIII